MMTWFISRLYCLSGVTHSWPSDHLPTSFNVYKPQNNSSISESSSTHDPQSWCVCSIPMSIPSRQIVEWRSVARQTAVSSLLAKILETLAVSRVTRAKNASSASQECLTCQFRSPKCQWEVTMRASSPRRALFSPSALTSGANSVLGASYPSSSQRQTFKAKNSMRLSLKNMKLLEY